MSLPKPKPDKFAFMNELASNSPSPVKISAKNISFQSPQHLKSSPTKLHLLSSNKNNLQKFILSKIPKGLQLNKLDGIQSMHESIIDQQNNNNFNKDDKSMFKSFIDNSLRNIVNESYFTNKQSEVSRMESQKSSTFMKLNNVEKQKNKVGQKDKYNNQNNSFKIKSRSSSNISSQIQKQKCFQKSSMNNVFLLTANKLNNQSPIKQQNSTNKNPINANTNTNTNTNKTPSKPKILNHLPQSRSNHLPPSSNKAIQQQQIQHLLTSHYSRSFIQSLIEYLTKNWSTSQQSLLKERKIQMLLHIIIQKSTHFNQLLQDFIIKQYDQVNKQYTSQQIKILCSILFKQTQVTIEQMRKIIEQLISSLPQDGILQQQSILQQLKKSLLQIYDPKYTYSSTKMKQRFNVYYQAYCSKRTSLQTQIKRKLRPQLSFILQVQTYFSSYQKQLIKMKSQVLLLEEQKQKLLDLLYKKTTFNPIQMNYQKLREMKEQAERKIKEDFQCNIVQFHNKKHEKNNLIIDEMKKQNDELKQQVEMKNIEISQLVRKLENYLNSIPKKTDASTQIFNMPMPININNNNNFNNPTQSTTNPSTLPLLPIYLLPLQYTLFISSTTSPFTFNQKITSSLLSILTIDKLLYDYEPIRNKTPLISFKQFIFQWFIIRTGNKKVAQILIKNFIYSVKKYKNKHKRFSMFGKIIGVNNTRGKNIQQDIQSMFYQSQLGWYYLIKITLMFRKKLNQNPSGYHIFPPIHCEQIFKLSLRRTYQLIQQFFLQQQLPVPEQLQQKIDHYAINQISKFKQHDQQFQKQSLQQIHILRQMNFDVIAGFVLDYIAGLKAINIQALLRCVHLKQLQMKNYIGYSQFENIYRKFYKEKRAKIQLIYSKFCLSNMNDVLNVENMNKVVKIMIEDQMPLRQLFDKQQTLRLLIVSQKQNINNTLKYQSKDKKIIVTSPNSFEHFRQRYYQEFYDFYDMTILLEEVYKIVKNLVKKKLKKINRDQTYIEKLLQQKQYEIIGEQKNQENKDNKQGQYDDEDQSDQSDQQEENQEELSKEETLLKNNQQKTYLEQKIQEWTKIQQRIPHFTSKVLTIDQIVVHNMRRKEMFEGCQFAWRTLREIMTAVTK